MTDEVPKGPYRLAVLTGRITQEQADRAEASVRRKRRRRRNRRR